MSERVAVREHELQPALGIGVLQALREIVLEMEAHDPYFEHIQTVQGDPSRE